MLECKKNCCEQKCLCPKKVEGACGGCQGSGCLKSRKSVDLVDINQEELYFIRLLEGTCYLPIAVFSDVEVAPVFVEKETQTLEETIEIARVLTQLEEKGILTLDYDISLVNCDYEKQFKNYYFDDIVHTAIEKQGSMALTQEYLLMVDTNYEERITRVN